jgi:hypothetical protein
MNSGERLSPTDRPHIAASDPYLDYGPPLPERYGLLDLRALVRDPRMVFAYWEWPSPPAETWAIRARDVATSVATIATLDRAGAEFGSRYFDVMPERTYEIDLGWIGPDGFVAVRTSNRVTTPREVPATEIDPEWAPEGGEGEVWRSVAGAPGRPTVRQVGYGKAGPSHG